MSRSKRIFFILMAIFFLLMIYIGYDISTRTTFPGSKPQLKERIVDEYAVKDTMQIDSTKSRP